MSGPVGHTFMYNIIIIFVVIVFAFLSGVMSYYKAFKVNNRIISSIEKFEGYNALSVPEIRKNLETLGYMSADPNWLNTSCKQNYKGMAPVAEPANAELSKVHRYCIYIRPDTDSGRLEHNQYYTYGVLTYMTLDLPIVNQIKIPIFTRTNRIYKFTKPNVNDNTQAPDWPTNPGTSGGTTTTPIIPGGSTGGNVRPPDAEISPIRPGGPAVSS